ncbi:hypothetical protein [Asanoa hainanensis]|uniref:hypothetical protein n=1 Tax=Asanoa hainanensis TaxID=560556 RepID=UPI0015C64A02|nr:hypothetical protein [Asanoa hainanensis]
MSDDDVFQAENLQMLQKSENSEDLAEADEAVWFEVINPSRVDRPVQTLRE